MGISNAAYLDLFHRGKMRFIATFQQPGVSVSDGAGGYLATYTDFLTTRCQLFKGSGAEIVASGQIIYNEDYTLRCGFRRALVINTDTLINVRGPGLPLTNFKIITWTLIDMREHLYEFKLSVNKING